MQGMRLGTTEDEVLIVRFQNGETEAFDRLMAIHTDKVFSLAWGVLQNREDAIDAAQEVFIKLYKALPKFPASDNLGAWLYRVCLNHCIDRKRRARHTGRGDDHRRLGEAAGVREPTSPNIGLIRARPAG